MPQAAPGAGTAHSPSAHTGAAQARSTAHSPNARTAGFPPLAKGGLGGVVPAKLITGFQTGKPANPSFVLVPTDNTGVRPYPPLPHLSKGGKGLAANDGWTGVAPGNAAKVWSLTLLAALPRTPGSVGVCSRRGHRNSGRGESD